MAVVFSLFESRPTFCKKMFTSLVKFVGHRKKSVKTNTKMYFLTKFVPYNRNGESYRAKFF